MVLSLTLTASVLAGVIFFGYARWVLLGFLVTVHLAAAVEASEAFCGASGSEMDAAVAEYGAAKDKLAMGFTKEGTVLLRGLLQRRPWFVTARWALARSEEGRGALMAAYGEYKLLLLAPILEDDKEETRLRLRALEAKSAPLATYAQAEMAAARKDWTAAAALATQVIEQKPAFALSYRLLGVAHASTGKIAEAAAAYRTYLKITESTEERHAIEEFLKDVDAGAFSP